MLIESNLKDHDKNIYKVVNSFTVNVSRITVSLILYERKIRRELVRININNPCFMFMYYKNGLYMCHLKVELVNGIFKRMMFLVFA